MTGDLIFPLALCQAQWRIWLHALEMFEIIGSHTLQQCAALTHAEADALAWAEDWLPVAMAPTKALQRADPNRNSHAWSKPGAKQARSAQASPSRQAVVHDALHTLHTALAMTPSARRLRTGRKTSTTRGKA